MKKLKKLLISAFCFMTIAPAFGCYNDYDCSYGDACVKPRGNYGNGVCVSPTNDYGVKVYGRTPQSQATQVNGCSFDTQCGIGASCMKRSTSDLYGICIHE